MSPMAAYVVETLVTLLAVLALAVLILYGARKFGVGRPHGPMQLIGRLPLDGRRGVYLVRIAEQVLVIGSSEAGLTRLGEISAKDLPVQPAGQARTFAEVIASLRSGSSAGPAQHGGGERRDE